MAKSTSVWEKATKERYASKSAARKHEKGEGPAERRKEYGKNWKRGMK